jgi:type III restriction enzyme
MSPGHLGTYRQVKDDSPTWLPGFAQDRSETELVGWPDQEIRDPAVRQPVLREWLRRAVQSLITDRGFSLAQLFKGRFVLRRKLIEQLQIARERALFSGDPELVATLDEPAMNFNYPQDMTRYPARRYYEGSYRFQKHYYPRPGDLDWKTSSGNLTEEFECAQAIDLLDEVEYWVRNVVHDTQFWMPTARQRTYPDFVAKLVDGRLFVVEYKGGDRFSSDQEKEKRLVGELWAKRSNGKCLYLMARKVDEAGRNVHEQLLATIST